MVVTLRSAVGIAAISLTAVAGVSTTAWLAIDRTSRDITRTSTSSIPHPPVTTPVPQAGTTTVDGDAIAASSPGMLNPGIYGTGRGYDVKANLWIGGPRGQKVAIKFKATTTSALRSVRFVQRGGPGYSLGTGGR